METGVESACTLASLANSITPHGDSLDRPMYRTCRQQSLSRVYEAKLLVYEALRQTHGDSLDRPMYRTCRQESLNSVYGALSY
jgi:hypothetical protein